MYACMCVISCFILLLWVVAQILYAPAFSCLVGTQVWSKLLPGIINRQEICEKIMQKQVTWCSWDKWGGHINDTLQTGLRSLESQNN